MKIVVGGQMDKQSIARQIEAIVGDKAIVEISSDIEAALAIKTGQADYYVGACSTGAGGALGIAIGLLGMDKCVSISTPAKTMTQEEIENEVSIGKVAFGFINYEAEKVIPMLIKAILK